jgi:hypothetical protein
LTPLKKYDILYPSIAPLRFSGGAAAAAWVFGRRKPPYPQKAKSFLRKSRRNGARELLPRFSAAK